MQYNGIHHNPVQLIMCGIFGFISNNSDEAELKSATDVMYSRGPDSAGYYFQAPVGLGHRRLSIIDLSTGHQPMFSTDGRLVLVFNGEIYNFISIKEELINLGNSFETTSDTEVILKAYTQWGLEACLSKLEGMFAFALWDQNLQKLFVVRDRFGEKPLYYTHNQHGFYFASELKSLKRFYSKDTLSKTAINLFFSLTYIPAPYTIYENIYKLEPGKYLELDSEANFTIKDFYNLKSIAEKNRKEQIIDYSLAKKQLRELLIASVEERMISDVPLGAFLSGGIDSSIISAIMAKVSGQPIKTFSIGFKEKAYDESERAALVAKHIKSDHTLHVLGHEDLLHVVNDTLAYFDEPFGDSSAIPSMMVAKKAKEKVTVVLTGDCADELFGGYEKYLGNYYANKYNAYPKFLRRLFQAGINKVPHSNLTNHTLRKIKKVIRTAELAPGDRYLQLTSLGFSPEDKYKFLKNDMNVDVGHEILRHYNSINEEDDLTKTFYSDIQLVLEGDMLTKIDRVCMMNSLEARVPFLDSKIVDFSFRLPHDFKIRGNNKKRILKDTFADLLPGQTLTFSKKGFDIPLRLWFQNELKVNLLGVIERNFIESQGIFSFDAIKDLFDSHMNSYENHAGKLWLIYVFQQWYLRNEK